jgi:hypothetical protein
MHVLRIIIPYIVFFISSGNTLCQPIRIQQINQLAALGKVWGFLKYYHPLVSQGKFNWDTTLVANYHKAVAAKNKTDFNILIDNIIRSAGLVPQSTAGLHKALDSLARNLSIKWINDTSIFSPANSKLLWNIYNTYKPVNNFYIKRRDKIGNAYFANETLYPVVLPSVEYRFLALCRFWNVINYYYPYKYLIPVSWDSILEEFIPRMINIQNDYAYFRTIQEMLTRLKDGHGIVMSDWGNNFSDRKLLPFFIRRIDSVFMVSRYIDTSVCFKENIKPGDTIVAIDELDTKILFRHHARYQAASNNNYLEYKTCFWMSVVKKKTISVNFQTKKDTVTKLIQTLNPPIIFHSANTKAFRLFNDSVGFLDLGKLLEKQVDSAFLLFRKTKYIIADSRNYPKWTMLAIADNILPRQTLIAQVCEPDFKNPGHIKWARPMFAGKKNPDYYNGTLIVLINDETMSQSELSVMIMKNAPKCITIGTQTAGAVGDVSTLPLPGGIKINYSGLGYYLPDYGLVQQKGIIPDIEVKTTRSGIIENKDEILERAMEYIRKGY